MGAPFLFYSSVGKVGDTFVVSATLVENGSAAVLQRQSVSVAGADQIVDALRVAAGRTFGEQAELSKSHWDILAWCALGVGAAAAVGGGVSTGLALSFRNSAEKTASRPDFETYRSRISTANTVSITGYITGGVLVSAALVYFLLPRNNLETGKPQALLLAAPLPSGFVLQTGFSF